MQALAAGTSLTGVFLTSISATDVKRYVNKVFKVDILGFWLSVAVSFSTPGSDMAIFLNKLLTL